MRFGQRKEFLAHAVGQELDDHGLYRGLRVIGVIILLALPGVGKIFTQQYDLPGFEHADVVPYKTRSMSFDRIMQLELGVIVPDTAEIPAFQVVSGVGLPGCRVYFVKVRLHMAETYYVYCRSGYFIPKLIKSGDNIV